jgi:predicted nuclease with TOPRIM domain
MAPKNKNDREKQAPLAEFTKCKEAVGELFGLQESVSVLESPEYLELQHGFEELKALYELLQSNANELQGDLVRLSQENERLKKNESKGRNDNVVHLAGVPYKIWHQAPTKEFFEDIKKRIVPEESICLSVVKV